MKFIPDFNLAYLFGSHMIQTIETIETMLKFSKDTSINEDTSQMLKYMNERIIEFQTRTTTDVLFA
jgi:hypothetical protein